MDFSRRHSRSLVRTVKANSPSGFARKTENAKPLNPPKPPIKLVPKRRKTNVVELVTNVEKEKAADKREERVEDPGLDFPQFDEPNRLPIERVPHPPTPLPGPIFNLNPAPPIEVSEPLDLPPLPSPPKLIALRAKMKSSKTDIDKNLDPDRTPAWLCWKDRMVKKYGNEGFGKKTGEMFGIEREDQVEKREGRECGELVLHVGSSSLSSVSTTDLIRGTISQLFPDYLIIALRVYNDN